MAPPSSRAQLCDPPAVTAMAVLMPATATGVDLCVVVPSPSWPNPLSPQQRMPPPTVLAHVNEPPAATEENATLIRPDPVRLVETSPAFGCRVDHAPPSIRTSVDTTPDGSVAAVDTNTG